MKRAVVHSEPDIAHELGYVGEWLTERGYTVERVYRDNTGAPFAFPPGDLLINLGSLSSAAEGYMQPAALAEIDAVKAWVDHGNPYIGICYGAQLLANALGGRVERQEHTHRSVENIDGPQELGPWIRWHEDFIVDSGSAHVMSITGSAIMLFRSGTAWGVQPHVELTPDTVIRMGEAAGTPPDVYLPLAESLGREQDRARESTFALCDFMTQDLT